VSRRRRERETPEYAGAVRRFIKAHGRRVADADPEDLADLVALVDVVDQAVAVAVRGLREQGHSWSAIARGLGITKQAAQQRFGRAPKRHLSLIG
jgi:DNA invertase Pin-like site-specific DNA recombinase